MNHASWPIWVATIAKLEDDPGVIGATLDAIDVDGIEDGTLGHLLRAKHRELGLQLEMLRSRGTSQFLPLSEELYGSVDSGLLLQAETILEQVAVPADDSDERVDATRFAELAENELAYYRAIEPDIGVHIEIRPDVSGVMVSGSVLLVSSATSVHTGRVNALLQHEVGTHLVTHINGSFQPIRMMATGLAGYEETQEGLAVFAEFLVGGLSTFRLRQLAARVVAVDRMMARERPLRPWSGTPAPRRAVYGIFAAPVEIHLEAGPEHKHTGVRAGRDAVGEWVLLAKPRRFVKREQGRNFRTEVVAGMNGGGYERRRRVTGERVGLTLLGADVFGSETRSIHSLSIPILAKPNRQNPDRGTLRQFETANARQLPKARRRMTR